MAGEINSDRVAEFLRTHTLAVAGALALALVGAAGSMWLEYLEFREHIIVSIEDNAEDILDLRQAVIDNERQLLENKVRLETISDMKCGA